MAIFGCVSSVGALRAISLVLGLICAAASLPARAGDVAGFSDGQLIDGFHKTVFGLEYGPAGYARMVKKFSGPVRLRVINMSAVDRRGEVKRFVARLPALVPGLDIAAVDGEQANFTVYVVDRANYAATVRSGVLGSHGGAVPGQCVVRIEPGARGIRRSTAVIVSDEGDALFRRCMVEEILQGLGPINDDASLIHSVFNDRSRHCRFMPFDRAIVAMLYDRRVRYGMGRGEVDALLPAVVADLRGRLY